MPAFWKDLFADFNRTKYNLTAEIVIEDALVNIDSRACLKSLYLLRFEHKHHLSINIIMLGGHQATYTKANINFFYTRMESDLG